MASGGWGLEDGVRDVVARKCARQDVSLGCVRENKRAGHLHKKTSGSFISFYKVLRGLEWDVVVIERLVIARTLGQNLGVLH